MDEYCHFIGTANRGYAQHAQEELRRLIPDIIFTYLLSNEVFSFEFKVFDQFINKLKKSNPIFLRHIQPVDTKFEITNSKEDLKTLKKYLLQLDIFKEMKTAAIQIRKNPAVACDYTSSEIANSAIEILKEINQIEIAARHTDWIVSIFVTHTKMCIGVSKPEHNLSDWSGGAIRFKKEIDQISRAKFKLLEAEIEFGLDFTGFQHALDVGAAPGGWTSLLLERGLQVTAIDPANLDSSLVDHPKLIFHKKNANEVILKSNEFDLVVCDMSWSPRMMSPLVSKLIYSLQDEGVAIITVKLMHKKAFQTIKEVIHGLDKKLHFNRAKQLFHNRDEITLYFSKNPEH